MVDDLIAARFVQDKFVLWFIRRSHLKLEAKFRTAKANNSIFALGAGSIDTK
jgi:hypothetical protein